MTSEAQLVGRESSLLGLKFDFLQCEACKVVSLVPEPSNVTIDSAYDDEYLPYALEERWGRFSRLVQMSQMRLAKRRTRWASAQLRRSRGDNTESSLTNPSTFRLLDFGYGSPRFLTSFANAHEESFCLGIDPFLATNLHSQGVHLARGNIESLENYCDENQKFDLVTLWHVVEHERDPVSLLKALLKVTKDGGKLILETPHFDTWARVLFGGRWPGYHTPRHMHLFTQDALTKALKTSGWKDLKFSRKGGFFDDFTFLWLMRLDLVLKSKKSLDLENEFTLYVTLKVFLTPLIWLLGLIGGRGSLLVCATKLPEKIR